MSTRVFVTRLYALVLCLGALAPAHAAPKVLVTLKPIHSLVAAVMTGAGAPDLLIGGALSEHAYALKPSDVRKLQEAGLIFEIGPDMESYLAAPLATRGKAVVVLERAPGVRLLPARHGGLWDKTGHDHGPADPHIWLDPQNAIAMTKAIAEALIKADPAHAALYRANAQKQTAALAALDEEIAATLAPVKARSYLVFHDAYQYFEARFGLKPLGAVTASPDRPAGARRLSTLREAVAAGRAACVFREPQFSPKLIDMLDAEAPARIGVLDPLGADLVPGPGLYPQLMRNLANSLRACLTKNR